MKISHKSEVGYKNSVTLGMYKETSNVVCPPSDDVPVEKKGEAWHLSWCKYIYNQDTVGSAFLNLDKRYRYEMLREYSDGKQSEEQYLDLFYQDTDEGNPNIAADREAWVNINSQIFSLMPKFKKIVVNKAKEFKFRPVITAIDDFSEMEREEIKYGLWAKSITKPIEKQINQMYGLPEQEDEILPQSFSELEMFKDLGMFKLGFEAAFEQAAIAVETFNYDDETRDKVIEDLFTLNFSCTHDYIDPFTQEIKYEYCDPNKLIILGGTKQKNFRDINATGYYQMWSVTDFKRAFPEYTSDDIKTLWQKFENYSFNKGITQKYDYLSDINNIADFYIPVLNCTFLCVDKYYEDVEVVITGKIKPQELEKKKLYEKDGKYYKKVASEEKGDIRVWRKAYWVIGTNIVFDYGLEHDQAADDSEVLPSYHIFELNGRSIVDVAIPVIDDLQLSWLQLQKLKATGRFSGMSVNINALQNLKIGKQDITALQAIDIFKQTSILLFGDRDPNTQQGITTGVPIMELQSHLAEDLGAVLLQIKSDIDLLRELTGISEIISASDPTQDIGLGVQQMSTNASVNAIRDIFDGWQKLKENTFSSIAIRIQNIAKDKENKLGNESMSGAIGKASWQMIVAASEKSLRKFGIKLWALPTEKQLADFEQMILVAMQSNKSGTPLITLAQATTLKRMLTQSHTSMKYIELYLHDRENKKAKEEQAIALQNQKVQGEIQQQLEDKKMENTLILKRAETEEELKLVYAKGYVDLLLQTDQQKIADYDAFMKGLMSTVQGAGQPPQPNMPMQQNMGMGMSEPQMQE